MEPEFWHQRWVRGEIGFHQQEINAHLQAFWDRLGLSPGEQVFVPLCGKTLDMLWLLSEGHRVLGVEISPMAVQGFFADNDIPVSPAADGPFTSYRADGLELLCGDFFDLTADRLDGVRGVYDRASLVALPPSMRERYVAHLKALFPGGLNALLVTLEYPDGEMEGPPFSVAEDEVRRLFGEGCEVEKLTVFNVLEDNPRFRERGLTRLQEKVYRIRAT